MLSGWSACILWGESMACLLHLGEQVADNIMWFSCQAKFLDVVVVFKDLEANIVDVVILAHQVF